MWNKVNEKVIPLDEIPNSADALITVFFLFSSFNLKLQQNLGVLDDSAYDNVYGNNEVHVDNLRKF